jgi:hypothetical protein
MSATSSQEQREAARSSWEQARAARSSHEQPGGARSSQEQPGRQESAKVLPVVSPVDRVAKRTTWEDLSSNHGTPAHLIGRSFDEPRNETQAQRNATRPTLERLLMYPRRKQTSLEAYKRSILSLSGRWNYQRPPQSCCDYHAFLDLLKLVTRELYRHECIRTGFAHDENGQCRRCGLMGEAGTICDCGNRIKKAKTVTFCL